MFGPILHVVRYQRGHLDKVIDAINATGYGLTLGLHSRIEAVADYVAEHARVGNLYVNRNQIGAVVGVQPFGGEGLSGTGPKAGGPHYLAAFAPSACARPTSRRPAATSSFFPARSPKAKPLRLFRANIAVGAASRHLGRNQCIRMPPMTPRKPTSAPPVSPSLSRAEKVPVAAEKPAQPPAPAISDAEVAAFIAKMKTLAPSRSADRGRLIFAMDATMSRAPTWDMALALQGDMFSAVKEVGGLDVQLVYFRGLGECRASKWVSDPDGARSPDDAGLLRMAASRRSARCSATRSMKSKQRKVNALVYVGDCMEEQVDRLCARAGELALARRAGVPVPGGRRQRRAERPSARSRG